MPYFDRMKKFFGRKKLKKSKSDIPPSDATNGVSNGGVKEGGMPSSKSTHLHAACSSDEWAVCSSMSEGERRKKFDSELDKHMMQTITDVKYILKRGAKFTAVGEVNFQRGCLDAHNDCRQRYGNPPLQWSQELADLAHSWATKVADRGRVLYPEMPGIGENMSVKTASEHSHLPTGDEIVNEWETEAHTFDFDRPRWHPKCQHFSQMVWRDSVEMGVAREWNTEKNCVAIVALYRPGGNNNAPGEFAANVGSRDVSLSPSRSLASNLKRVTISTPQKTTESNHNHPHK
ncbi:hypothetical protein PFISCL1PPCAC_3526 [Pristionchus fissidentatus]|uniref:SCP domain-containing protein n=1 Tax=Pristionchus fissidentatus TaxID=1538716 RepID=A0AAV5UYN1_9BILA|nr:hypothetical protein PFISCL1PPCAC_3526 [Pristionchus fissidentatus]